MEARSLKKSIANILLILILFGCNTKSKKTYYDSGELKEEIEILDGNCFIIKTFSITGKLLSNGKLCDNLKEGIWEEYYSDGMVKWKGLYNSGKRQHLDTIPEEPHCKLTIKENPEYLKVGTTYHLRANVANIHPDDLVIMVDNGIIKPMKDKGEYDFEMMPEKQGNLKLQVLVSTTEGVITLCEVLFEVR